jgi:hypothetical protein
MQLEDDVRIGTRVQVQVDYVKPHRRGSIGTIKKCYGGAEYQVFEVSFPDGQTELFWQHQLKQAKESSPRRKRLRWGRAES